MELLLLKIRNLIAREEFNTASANLDLSRGGWTCDWNARHCEIGREIDELLERAFAMEGSKSR